MNRHLNTIIVAPITGSRKSYPTRVEIELYNLRNWVVIDQIKTIDRQRIIKSVGFIKQAEIDQIKNVLREAFVD